MSDPLIEPDSALEEAQAPVNEAREETLKGILSAILVMLDEHPKHAPPQLAKAKALIEELDRRYS
jgi:hypothetical protein